MTPSEILETLQYLTDIQSNRDLQEAISKRKRTDEVPNPHFVANGIEGSSENTLRNLHHRRIKAFASKIFGSAGGAASAYTAGVNTAEVARNGAALASTVIHLKRFMTLASKVRDGGSLHRNLMALCGLKSAKAAARGAHVAIAFIPVPGISVAGKFVGKAHEQFLAYQKALILKLAIDLHWQAYREIKIGGPSTRAPAVDICRQLVCLSVTHLGNNGESALDIGGLHSVAGLNAILSEPLGYLVILHKLNQT